MGRKGKVRHPCAALGAPKKQISSYRQVPLKIIGNFLKVVDSFCQCPRRFAGISVRQTPPTIRTQRLFRIRWIFREAMRLLLDSRRSNCLLPFSRPCLTSAQSTTTRPLLMRSRQAGICRVLTREPESVLQSLLRAPAAANTCNDHSKSGRNNSAVINAPDYRKLLCNNASVRASFIKCVLS